MIAQPTGSQAFDELLEGGYERGIITAIYGPAGSGKSNLTLLALTAVQKRAIFMDTEGSFSVDRLHQLVPEVEKLLERVIVIKAHSLEEQTKAILKLPRMVQDDIELVIVDGIANQYRAAIARGVRDVNNHLSQQMNALFQTASEHDIPVLITSQVYADLDGEGVKVVGGDIVKYSSKCMIELRYDNGKRSAVLTKHRFVAPGRSRKFVIDNVGIYEEK